MVRNELFGRFLYLFVNTCFAHVRKNETEGPLIVLTMLFGP